MKGVSFFLIILTPLLCLSAQSKGTDLTFSEVMFNPATSNCEFIEIYNLSKTESADLSHFQIRYQSSSIDSLISTGKDFILAPHAYAVIFEGDYDLSSGLYSSITPASALILKIKDNAFGSSGMSNTSDRTIFLIYEKNDTVDSYTYSANNNVSISDEKIILNKNNSQVNWANSIQKNGTPGLMNSVISNRNGISIVSAEYSPLYPSDGQDVLFSFTIKNTGFSQEENLQFELFNDINFDSAGTQGEVLHTQTIETLSPGDSAKIRVTIKKVISGSYQIIAEVSAKALDETVTDKKVIKFMVKDPPYDFNDIVVNEIMYAPASGEPEWVELYNRSIREVNLKKWRLRDLSTSPQISQKDEWLKAGEYVVICKDSTIKQYYRVSSDIIYASIPSLNNSGDVIVLSDSTGKTIDSTYYLPSWGGNNGFSLERIDPNVKSNDPLNWKTCRYSLKGTPGKCNSNSKKKFDLMLSEIIFIPSAPVLNDQVRISSNIKNSGSEQNSFRLFLAEDSNFDKIPDILLETSENLTLLPGDSIKYYFSFQVDKLRFERSFFVKIYSETDEDTSDNFLFQNISPGHLPGSILINEIMYAPIDGEPEWIELFNTTQDTISLKNWTIGDLLPQQSSTIIPSSNNIIPPLAYAVLAKDSSIYKFHPHISSGVITSNFPALNNDEDGVILKDSRGITIDSTRYSTALGGQSGHSLERKFFEKSSNDPSNWAASKDIKRSTPGQVNSCSQKDFDPAIAEISFSPLSPHPGDSIYVSVKIVNNGKKDVRDFSVQIFCKDDEMPEPLFVTNFPIPGLSSSSSILLSSPYPVLMKRDLKIIAKLFYSADQDTINNYCELKINPGYNRNALVINEIMYAPVSGEAEWFELLNTSDQTINLSNWYFTTISSAGIKNKITVNDSNIPPGNFAIIARDSLMLKDYPDLLLTVINFKSLGNTSDGIALYDSWGNLIDSLNYSFKWGGRNGSSLERFSPYLSSCDSTNWSGSISSSHSTPGLKNSVAGLIQYSRNSVVINEIMFDPSLINCQFIELFNSSSSDIDLADWQIFNKNGNYNFLSERNLRLPKGEYFIFASDSSIFSNYPWLYSSGYCNISANSALNLLKTEDRITIKDAFGNVIDSVSYSSKWHSKNITETKNKSIERVNPLINSNYRSNWSSSTSQEGATPGKLNSIFVLNQKADKRFSVLPNPFSPDNDGLDDFTIINYNFDDNISDIRVKIFDSHGRLVRTLLSQTPGPHGSIIFDGMDDQGVPLRIGIYIVLLEELNSNSLPLETIKSVVVVARKL